MKKKIALLLLAVMTMSLVACGGNGDDTNASVGNDTNIESSVEPTAAPTEEPVAQIASALEILENVWANFDENYKFFVAGGDSANMTMDAPGAFDATNTEELDYFLGYPAAEVSKIDGAASMMHAMNANTFTCGVFHLTDSANMQTVADALKTSIMARQWMCGFPDTLIVISIDDYVLSAFGNGEVIEVFKNKVAELYGQSTLVYEESLAF